jgi:hypothetical protein
MGTIFGGIYVETPAHTVLSKKESYEVRECKSCWGSCRRSIDSVAQSFFPFILDPASVWASTEYDDDNFNGSSGFRPLASFIFGKNRKTNSGGLTVPAFSSLDY